MQKLVSGVFEIPRDCPKTGFHSLSEFSRVALYLFEFQNFGCINKFRAHPQKKISSTGSAPLHKSASS